jgi:hypothetical protein
MGRKHPDVKIWFQTHYPDLKSMFTVPDADWMHTVYGEHKEESFKGLPELKGKMAQVATFIDSGLYHCRVT